MKIPDKTIEEYVTEYIIEHGHQPEMLTVSNEAYAYGILTHAIKEKRSSTFHGYLIIRADYHGISIYTEYTMGIRNESVDKERADNKAACEHIQNMRNFEPGDYTISGCIKSLFGFK